MRERKDIAEELEKEQENYEEIEYKIYRLLEELRKVDEDG